MAVDFIPFAYRGTMRAWDGSTFLVDWCKVPESTPLIPFVTPFRSGRPIPSAPFDDGQVGEICNFNPQRSRARKPDRICSDCYIGDPTWWTTGWPMGTPGVTIAADGWPVGCDDGGAPFDFGWDLGYES